MSSSLVLLCPGGHRVKVSTNPNMSLLAVQETACSKKGLDVNKLALEHRGKRLDRSLTVRFSGLPNNATLELVELGEEELEDSRKEEKVTVCLQVESERLVEAFPPSCTLSQVLAKWENRVGEPGAGEQPVLVYMRREIVGEAELERTTLRTLGLTSGKGLFRFFFKQPEVLRSQANVYDMKEKEKKEVIEKPHLPMRLEPELATVSSSVVEAVNDEQAGDKIGSLEESGKDSVKNEIDISQVEEVSSRSRNDTPSREITIPSPEENDMDMLPDSSDSPVVEPVGPHGALVFKAEEGSAGTGWGRNQQLDDEFFELSIEEVKGRFRELKQETKRLEQGEMLMTQQMREAAREGEKLSLVSRYKTSLLRVQLPCRHVVQGQFPPSTTISDVTTWLAPLLQFPESPCELCTSPPRTVLSSQATLLDLCLYPAALVYMASIDTNLSGQYLKEEVLCRLSNTAGANKVAAELRRQAIRSGASVKQAIQGELFGAETRKLTPVEEEATQGRPSGTDSSAGSKKAPKWFKPSK